MKNFRTIRSFHFSALREEYSPYVERLHSPSSRRTQLMSASCGPPARSSGVVRWAQGGGRPDEGVIDLPRMSDLLRGAMCLRSLDVLTDIVSCTQVSAGVPFSTSSDPMSSSLFPCFVIVIPHENHYASSFILHDIRPTTRTGVKTPFLYLHVAQPAVYRQSEVLCAS